MPHYAILNRHVGILVWSGEYQTPRDAFIDYYIKAKIDPDGNGWAVMMQTVLIHEVPPDKVEAVEAWGKRKTPHGFPLKNE